MLKHFLYYLQFIDKGTSVELPKSNLEQFKAEMIVAKAEFKTSQQDYNDALDALKAKKTILTEEVFATAKASKIFFVKSNNH